MDQFIILENKIYTMEGINGTGMSTWDIFAIVGTVSFALQGGMIAMEEKYDLFAVYLFGMLTSFGSGVLQNILIGGSEQRLWKQEELFLVAFLSVTVALFFPTQITKNKIFFLNLLDSFGVMAFAIQGSIRAINFGLPTSAVIVSAIITATGGGIIRDLLLPKKTNYPRTEYIWPLDFSNWINYGFYRQKIDSLSISYLYNFY